MRCRIAGLLLWLVAAAPPAAAAPHRPRVHANPSLTILAIAAAPDASVLYLAASDGLYRFDGFHFRKLPGYPFATARNAVFTNDGSLWVAAPDGLARFRDGAFEVILKQQQSVTALATLGDHVLVAAEGSGYRVDPAGTVTPVEGAGTPLRGWYIDGARRAWFYCAIPEQPGRVCRLDATVPAPGLTDPPRTVLWARHPAMPAFEHVAPDAQGRLWVAVDTRAEATAAGGTGPEALSRRFTNIRRESPLVAGFDGKLWFVGETVHGIDSGIEFRLAPLPANAIATAGHQDARGRFWLALQGVGLVEWTADTAWERWPAGETGGAPAGQIVRTAQGEVVLAGQNNLYRLDARTRTWHAVAREPRRYASILPLPNGGFLASIRKFGLARLSSSGEVIERVQNPLVDVPYHLVDHFRLLFPDRAGNVWVGNKNTLLRLEGRPGAYRLSPVALPPVSPESEGQEAVDFELDRDGNVWTGYEDGIARRDASGAWERIAVEPPIAKVRSLALAGDRSGDDIWVAFRRSGPFARLRRSGGTWKATHFDTASGYGPNDTHFLRRDSRGWIWRGSTDGVHISDGTHVGPGDWLRLDAGNGLVSGSTDQYGFFEDDDGSVWISGEDGVTHLRPDPAWFTADGAGTPRVTHFEQRESLVRVELGSLGAPPFRREPLRYRLLPPAEAPWRTSATGTLEFAGLAAGAYTLEAGFAGGPAAALTLHRFEVAAAPGLRWIWLLAPLPAAALGMMALVRARRSLWWMKADYGMRKALFLLRRRWGGRDSGSSPSVSAPLRDLAGETLGGRYRLIRVVARGGFSTVYEAVDLANAGGRVVVKMINATTGTEGWVRDRFAQEVAALQMIRHPGVVPILDSWVGHDGEPCLAMPFLEGPTLSTVLAHGALPVARAGRLARRLGSALAEVHSRGVVHRDLKPDNIIISGRGGTDDELPVLIDFGTAGLRGAESELAATTMLSGSLAYLAPERLTGHYSPASDVYAFGIIVLEMLSGRRLASLQVMFSDPGFHDAMARAVAPCVGVERAGAVAEALVAVFDPAPGKRPKAWDWTERICGILDEA